MNFVIIHFVSCFDNYTWGSYYFSVPLSVLGGQPWMILPWNEIRDWKTHTFTVFIGCWPSDLWQGVSNVFASLNNKRTVTLESTIRAGPPWNIPQQSKPRFSKCLQLISQRILRLHAVNHVCKAQLKLRAINPHFGYKQRSNCKLLSEAKLSHNEELNIFHGNIMLQAINSVTLV